MDIRLRGILRAPWTARSNQSYLKGNQPWIFTERTNAEIEPLILWPPDAKSWLIEKTLKLGKIEGRRRRGRQDEMVGWCHQLTGHEFEQTPGDSEGQGSHEVAKSQTQLSNWTTQIFTVTFPRPPLRILFLFMSLPGSMIHSSIESLSCNRRCSGQ